MLLQREGKSNCYSNPNPQVTVPLTIEERILQVVELKQYIKEDISGAYPFESLDVVEDYRVANDDNQSNTNNVGDEIERPKVLDEQGFDKDELFLKTICVLKEIRTVKSKTNIQPRQLAKGFNYATKPLKFWKENEKKYPLLSMFAMKYLGVCATSVPSERLFSTAKRIINSNRANLAPEMAEINVTLSCWQKEIGTEATNVFL